ncbi:hypothetical protein PBI_OMNICRON_91 [Mycobacterium phage Omnicron]|uniref:Uncharacterized protein n=2 Tax=Kratiovirus TaxID=2948788 RepID=A0A088FUW9_9CAUD|nr:DNA binding protein [Mycobacterium phage Omnicron]YP_009950986.1 DNA binding protein [Mycobacterium phage Rando14]AIM50424.1 hypothetical protein PBI_OMNICRON_91 [Mycobacterium phage Omnicron]AXQ53108.1 hypothetical protein SEA_RANDO14_88 [Mycobacterium phage Rando14]
MSNKPSAELKDILNEVARDAEVHDMVSDDVDLTDVKVTRGGPRTRVLQIRLNDDELAELERQATARDLPASTVAREILLRALFPRKSGTATRADFAEAILSYVDFVVDRQLAARVGSGVLGATSEAHTAP